ncbi:MAG: hypothetical protein K6F96_02640 [Bacteroidales bacterium]|nr:hypothetical protein [Bacteroidales bacterium]
MAPQKYAFRFLFLMVSLVLCLTSWGQMPLGDNLVVNGDFENGKMGFQSQYTYFTNTLGSPGSCKYCIDTDASSHYGQGSGQPWKGNGSDGQGHYDSNSKFLMASGGNVNKYVWRTTINVNPHTDYEFEAWICHLFKSFGGNYTATLKFTINGADIGVLQTPNHRNGYVQFTHSWNSGTATTAEIAIYDTNPYPDAGNDFGLDDISFRERLVVGPISWIAPICAGSSLTLTPPEVYCNNCSGRWEIIQGNTIIESFNSNYVSSVPSSWNGKFIRYAVNYQGFWHYSNVVSIAVEDLNVSINLENTEICEGEEVILHAIVPPAVFYAPGDILCTDGSVVKPSNWPCGKTAKGIVFYVDASGQHGWAVDKNITPCRVSNDLNNTVVKWSSNTYSSNVKGDVPGLHNYNQWKDAVKDFDGYSNTRIIREYTHVTTNDSATFPAAWSVDFDNGWYLPAAGQLNVLFGEILLVNASLALSGVGGTQISTAGDLWSSTEFLSPDYTYTRALKIQLNGNSGTGRVIHEEKKQKKTLRAVINF